MKKILSLILALLMTASCAATIFADDTAIADGATEETTATEATPYDLALELLDKYDIIQGKGNGDLAPADPVKRYEMAIFATRISTGIVNNANWEDGPINGTEFTDLEGSGAANALGALSYANQHGIVNGYGDGTFKPENTVTYRDALVMACRTLGYTGLEYKWGYIEKAVTLGLTEGITNVAYTDEINRGVAAQIIYNALFAKTAAGKKLAQESFGIDYGWKKIVVVADGRRNYTADVAPATYAKHVAFKFVEKDGTFSDEILYVDNTTAGLKFGEFYNAFIGKVDGEYVDLFKTIQIEPAALITNDGNDDADGVHDDIAAALATKTIKTKYTFDANFNKFSSLVRDDETILVTPGSKFIQIGYNVNKGTYAFNWETGDILKKDANGVYQVEWHYNAKYDIYFNYKESAVVEGNYVGINIMDDDDLAALKVSIEESYKEYAAKDGYIRLEAKPTAGMQYASLLPYDLDGNGSFDYAKYEQYSFGYYGGTSEVNCTNHKRLVYNLGGGQYEVADCHGYIGYTWAEGYAPTTTGYVIYGVNKVTKELKIIKEIRPEANKTDADSYVATGVVRGFDVAGKKITIGENTYSWDINTTLLPGAVVAPDTEKLYDKLFMNFVEYVLVDNKVALIDASGSQANNYIVVEKYLGIDNDGYIVIQGYTTDARVLSTFRIGAYDGWKQGSGFFYGNEIELEENFVKGNIYRITSIDTTDANGPIYYVTAFGIYDEDTDKIVGVNTTAPVVEFTFEDNYRITDNTTLAKMTVNDTYVIVGETDDTYNFKPIYFYKGIVPADGELTWKVKGNLLVNNNGLFVFVNVEENNISGFNRETNKTSFVATLDNELGVRKVSFDGYESNYYYYGATKYVLKAFDLIQGKEIDNIAAYNFKPELNSIYVTIDNEIVDDTALTYDGFETAMNQAYGDRNLDVFGEDLDTAAYIPFTFAFTSTTTVGDISKAMSKTLFNLKREHADLIVNGLTVFTITKDANKNLTKITAGATVDFTKVASYNAFCIYDVAANKVIAYLDASDFNAKPTPAPVEVPADLDIPAIHKIEVAKDVYVTATANVSGKQLEGKWTEAKVDTITFAWDGDALKLMNHNTIDINDYHFGDTGYCKTENWNLQLGVTDTFAKGDVIALDKNLFDKVEVATFDGAHEECVDDCDCIKSVTIALDKALEVGKEVFAQVFFTSYEDVDGAAGNKTYYRFTVRALLNAEGAVSFDYYAGTYEEDGATKSYIGFDGVKYTTVATPLVKAE